MNQLNKNRFIGGSVLLFAALLFAPSILTPEKASMKNPTFTVDIRADDNTSLPSPQTVVETQTNAPDSSLPVIQLESVPATTTANESAVAQAETPSKSISSSKDNNTNSVSVVFESKTPKKPSQVLKSSWLRVGSFNNEKNANDLLKKLKARFPVKIETTTVDNKTYHRVLVGPYNNEKTLQTVKKALSDSGYEPGVQR